MTRACWRASASRAAASRAADAGAQRRRLHVAERFEHGRQGGGTLGLGGLGLLQGDLQAGHGGHLDELVDLFHGVVGVGDLEPRAGREHGGASTLDFGLDLLDQTATDLVGAVTVELAQGGGVGADLVLQGEGRLGCDVLGQRRPPRMVRR